MSFPAKVKLLFEKLYENGYFSAELAERLCDIEYCRSQGLQTEFPVLRIKGESEFSDCGSYRRYYPKATYKFSIGARDYIFTNNWYAKNAGQLSRFFEEYLDAEFVSTTLYGDEVPAQHNPVIIRRVHRQGADIANTIQSWPEWETPTNEEIRNIAQSLTPHFKFLHPDIVEKITESNKVLDSYFREYLSQANIDIDSYIWEGCSTMFPGIRRANGKTDTDYKKKQLPIDQREQKGAIYIDDNSYAKQVWAFIFTKMQFSNRGPNGYELAHLFEHKAVDRLGQELVYSDESAYDTAKPISGMFTCAAGLAYSPRSFVKISDHSLHARRLLQRRALKLYKGIANILPSSVKLKEQSDEWDVNSFKWGEPVGDPANTDLFLNFRKERIQRILALEIPRG